MKTNKHGHDAVGHEDSDVNNDGKVNGSDRFLKARRNAIAKAKMKEEVELGENIAGRFKDASEWESAAKSRGLVVKSMTHPSGETTKYQIAKDKQGNNRGHFDHGTKTGHLKEEVEQIGEETPPSSTGYTPSKAYMQTLKIKYHGKDKLSPKETENMHKELKKHTVDAMKHIANSGIDHISTAAKNTIQKRFDPSFQKEQVELEEAEVNYVIKHKKTKQVLNTHSDLATAKDEHEGLGADKHEYGVYKQTKKDAALRNRNTYREEVELEEGITNLSHARLKFHATKGVPHGSYTNKQIKDEHNRRLKTEPDYHKVKASLNETNIIPTLDDRPTPTPNRLAYKLDKEPKKKVSLPKAPWDVKKEETELGESSEHHRIRDDLKSEGKYKEAGEHAYKHGLGRSYGPHFGMRSSKNSAEMEFHKGYDHAQARESRAARLAKEETSGKHYAIGMAAAKKMHNDEPPLEKATIKKAHKIAKAIAKEHVELEEAGMPASVIKQKTELASMSDKEFAEKHGSKSDKDLRSMAWRHGYGKPGTPGHDHYVRRVAKGSVKEEAEQIDEVHQNIDENWKAAGYERGQYWASHPEHGGFGFNDKAKRDKFVKRAKASNANRSEAEKLHKSPHQIDELSKDTLHSYWKKAAVARVPLDAKARKAETQKTNRIRSGKPLASYKPKDELTPDEKRVRTNRSKGMDRAGHKLFRSEEVEQINELDKSTLGSYATKALQRGDIAARMSKSDDDEMGKIANKRMTGVKKAVDKIAGKKKADATRVKTNVDKAREDAKNRGEGKPYYAAQKGINKLRESVDSSDKKPENYVDAEGKQRTRMVKAKRNIVKEHTMSLRSIMEKLTEEELQELVNAIFEEAEQIDEISQEKLRDYHAAAGADLRTKRQKLDKGTLTSRDFKKGQNRVKGLNRAANKMAEEAEQIDELSRKTLASYAKKASADHGEQIAKGFGEYEYGDPRKGDKAYTKADKRKVGVNKAIDKLAKEEVEQIDELSKKTLASYAKKASANRVNWASKGQGEYEYGSVQKGDEAYAKADKRGKGINKAIDKLAKEDFDPIAETAKFIAMEAKKK